MTVGTATESSGVGGVGSGVAGAGSGEVPGILGAGTGAEVSMPGIDGGAGVPEAGAGGCDATTLVSGAGAGVGEGPSPGMMDSGEVMVKAGTEVQPPPEDTGVEMARQSETVMVVVTVQKRVSKNFKSDSLMDDLPSRARRLRHFSKRAASSKLRISKVPATKCQLCKTRQD